VYFVQLGVYGSAAPYRDKVVSLCAFSCAASRVLHRLHAATHEHTSIPVVQKCVGQTRAGTYLPAPRPGTMAA
jgi:hypothetical protein